MATFTVKNSNGRFTLELTVVEESVDVKNNSSLVAYRLRLIANTSYHFTDYAIGSKVVLDGKTVHEIKRSSAKKYSITGNSYITLAGGKETIQHNADGSKTLPIAFSIDMAKADYTPGALSGTGEHTLTFILKSTKVTQYISSDYTTETSVSVGWQCPDGAERVLYSIDDGSTWKEIKDFTPYADVYQIDNLKPNTTYKIITQVERKGDGVVGISEPSTVKTYDFPHCVSAPNFTVGDVVTLKFYNPLDREFTFNILVDGKSIEATYTCASTSHTGVAGSTSINALYKAIPNKKETSYSVQVNYKSSVKTLVDGGVYKIKGTEAPVVGDLVYLCLDGKYEGEGILGPHVYKVIQDISNVTIGYTRATSNFGASIKKYDFTIGNKTTTQTPDDSVPDDDLGFQFGTVPVSRDADIVMTVTDTRGLTATTSIPIDIVPYQPPSAKVTLERLNNYENETYLTIDGTYSSVDGQNFITVQYRYKEDGADYNDYLTVNDNEKQTLNMDKEKVFIFEVVVTDKFGNQFTKEYTLGKGVFPLFIDTVKNSIGINTLPTHEKSLEIDGNIYGVKNRILWSGTSQMGNGEKITLAEPVSAQMTGIVLVFTYYAESEAKKFRIQSFFKSKAEIDAYKDFVTGKDYNDATGKYFLGGGYLFHLISPRFEEIASKYMYINDTQILGNELNTETGTGTSGVAYNNNKYCLTYVIGV